MRSSSHFKFSSFTLYEDIERYGFDDRLLKPTMKFRLKALLSKWGSVRMTKHLRKGLSFRRQAQDML